MSGVVEAVRQARQKIDYTIHAALYGDEIYPRIPLEVRTLPFNTRWQGAENLDPLLKREFVRQEVMDLMGNVDERGGKSNLRYAPVSVDQLRSSSLPSELVEFIVGGVEDEELRKRMVFATGTRTSEVQLRMDTSFATYQGWANGSIRLVLAKTTPDGIIVPAHEFGLAVDATMPPFSTAEKGPKAEIYDAALHLGRPGTSGTAMVDMVARHKDRYDALLAYKHNTSKVAIARQLIAFGQQVLQTPHE